VRRTARGNEMNFVQMKAALCGARHGQMADVNGIERAAEKRDGARSAVRPMPVRLNVSVRLTARQFLSPEASG